MLSEALLLLLATAFGVSFITNATPFFGASYTLIATAELISSGYTFRTFALLVLVTGLGATLAKTVVYSGALGFRRQLRKNKNVRLFQEWFQNRSFSVALFVTALTPVLPLDDYMYIGAGANKSRLASMLGVTLPAKVTKSAIEMFLEYSGVLGLSALTRKSFGLSGVQFPLILSILFIGLGIFLFKLDWESLLKRVGVVTQNHPKLGTS